jgi:hypothetical protein
MNNTAVKTLLHIAWATVDVGAHQKARDSGLPPDGLKVGRKLAGVAVHG